MNQMAGSKSEVPTVTRAGFDTDAFAPEERLKAFGEYFHGGKVCERTSLKFEPLSSDNQNCIKVEVFDTDGVKLAFLETSGFLSGTVEHPPRPADQLSVVTVGIVTEGLAELRSPMGSHMLSPGDVYINAVDSFRTVWGPGRVTRLKFAVENHLDLHTRKDDLVIVPTGNPINEVAKSVFDGLETSLREGPGKHTGLLTTIAKSMTHNILARNEGAVSNNRYEVIKARACDFILKNLGEPDLDIVTIAGHVNTSRATLYRVFASEGGVKERINRERLIAAAKILQTATPTRGLVHHVASVCGFASPNQLGRSFREHFGVSPSDFNRRHFESRIR